MSKNKENSVLDIPVQFLPSPVKPSSHAQLNDAKVLLHVALGWQ